MAKTITKKTTKNKEEKSLVIVESPAKAKTIKKILGDSFEIKASYGHIRDFPKKVLGFDVNNNFEPTFDVIPEKKKVVDELNKSAKKVDKIYLAPDPDREGEAIAWHISEILNFPEDKIYRIEFNEITQNAIRNAVENPRSIDFDKVNAQKTRQILDRLVGYKICPILWKKLSNYKLSAGRVQSVAVKLICEREAEIEAFNPQEYWTIIADFAKQKSNFAFQAELTKENGEKIEINDGKKANAIVDKFSQKGVEFIATKTTERNTKRNPQAPFITSTLQREASSKLGYGVSKTMQVAQKLYEGIEMGSSGPIGLITYMRTDSTRISDEAAGFAKEYIIDNFGKKYYPQIPKVYAKKGKNVQDAHEAIRPTYIDKTPSSIKEYLTNDQYKLYKLIWSRFIASQMESADVKNTSVEIEAEEYTFRAGTSKVMFDGFLIVYDDREEKQESQIPDIKKGDKFKLCKIDPQQHFTQPPPRYSEASLVKTLEDYGIGRPSTYASIITKIQQKIYVIKEDKSLKPTALGKVVNEQLINHFSQIMDYKFTAGMETKLDEIAEEGANWQKVLEEFYEPFIETVGQADKNMEKVEILSDEVCPNCGKPMKVKTSRWGSQFLGCSGYPECKTMISLDKDQKPVEPPKETDKKCPKCNSTMMSKQGPYGQYLECSDEKCKHREKIIIKTGVKCPNEGCDGELIQRKSRYGKVFYGCNKYPDCNFAIWNEPTSEKCPDCGALLVKKFLKRGNQIACSSKECKYSRPMEEENNES
ncbi:MAG: type I DNA topoisomerase [Candidatus Gastranaerophilales bacterium]|nr:type I DNA topoisomerase [Candidatus Gastranaerophilales bacterium]